MLAVQAQSVPAPTAQLLPEEKTPAGAPAPPRRPIRLRPWAMICRKLAMHRSGLRTLTVIVHSILGEAYGDLRLLVSIITFYALFVPQKDTNLPLGIVDVTFIAQSVSFWGAN